MSPIYHPHQIISSNTHQTKVRLRASAYKITKTGQCFHLAIFDSTKTQPLLQINPTTAGIPNLGQILLQYHRNKKKLFIIPKSLNAKKKTKPWVNDEVISSYIYHTPSAFSLTPSLQIAPPLLFTPATPWTWRPAGYQLLPMRFCLL